MEIKKVSKTRKRSFEFQEFLTWSALRFHEELSQFEQGTLRWPLRLRKIIFSHPYHYLWFVLQNLASSLYSRLIRLYLIQYLYMSFFIALTLYYILTKNADFFYFLDLYTCAMFYSRNATYSKMLFHYFQSMSRLIHILGKSRS